MFVEDLVTPLTPCATAKTLLQRVPVGPFPGAGQRGVGEGIEEIGPFGAGLKRVESVITKLSRSQRFAREGNSRP